jgi:predicted nucleotidyltransferase
MTRDEGITIACRFREAVLAKGYPVQRVVVFGSVARDEATEDSDLDIAVICEPFAASRMEENLALRRLCWDIDVRIEPCCLHANDFENRLFALPLEVEREGIEV